MEQLVGEADEFKPPRNRPKRPTQKTTLQNKIIDSRSREPARSERTVLRVRHQREWRKARAVCSA